VAYIVSIDACQAVIDAINGALPTFGESVPVGTRVPAGVAEFYRVDLAGGGRETIATDAFRILLEAWAGDEQRAARLLNIGRAILFAQTGPLFGVSEYAGPTNLPDPTTDRVRYTASLVVRARAAQTA
jgi:hypothetical protein